MKKRTILTVGEMYCFHLQSLELKSVDGYARRRIIDLIITLK